MELILTTNRAESSYGIPVLVIDGQAYGPADLVDGKPVAEILLQSVKAYLAQCPEGPQIVASSPK